MDPEFEEDGVDLVRLRVFAGTRRRAMSPLVDPATRCATTWRSGSVSFSILAFVDQRSLRGSAASCAFRRVTSLAVPNHSRAEPSASKMGIAREKDPSERSIHSGTTRCSSCNTLFPPDYPLLSPVRTRERSVRVDVSFHPRVSRLTLVGREVRPCRYRISLQSPLIKNTTSESRHIKRAEPFFHHPTHGLRGIPPNPWPSANGFRHARVPTWR